MYTSFRALNLAEDMGSAADMAWGYSLAQVLVSSIPWPGVAKRYRALAAEALSRVVDEPLTRSWVIQMDAVYELSHGNLEAAERRGLESCAIATELGAVRRVRESRVVAGYAQLHAGNFAAAHANFLEVLRLSGGTAVRYDNWALAVIALVALRRGRQTEARDTLTTLGPMRAKLQERTDRFTLLATEAMILLRTSDPSAAFAAAQAGVILLRDISPSMMEANIPISEFVEVLTGLCVNRSGAAEPRHRDTLGEAADCLDRFARVHAFLRPEHLLVRGVLAWMSGRQRDAETALARAADEAVRLGMPVGEIRALRALARVRATGPDPRATALERELRLAPDPWVFF